MNYEKDKLRYIRKRRYAKLVMLITGIMMVTMLVAERTFI